MKSCRALSLLLSLLCLPVCAQSNYRLDAVVAAMRTPLPKLVLLSSHRGLWRNEPENTEQSVNAAIAANIETIEVDVRMSAEGTPWLLHDRQLNRHSTGDGLVEQASDAYLASLYVRDRHEAVTDSPVITFERMLRAFIAYNSSKSKNGVYRGYILIADIKPTLVDPHTNSYRTLLATWKVMQRLEAETHFPVSRYVVMKVQARALPDAPALLAAALGSTDFHLTPVFFGDPNPDARRKEGAVFNAYFKQSTVPPYLTSAEVFMTTPGNDPAAAWITTLQSKGLSISGFPVWDEYPEGTALAVGTCCVDRSQDPRQPGYDYAGSWMYWLQLGATWITGDQVDTLQNYLTLVGKRDTHGIE